MLTLIMGARLLENLKSSDDLPRCGHSDWIVPAPPRHGRVKPGLEETGQ